MSDETNPAPQHESINRHEEFMDYLATLPPVYGRKLLFSEKCGLAYALSKGERADVVAEAFNLSHATISQLARCLQPHGKAYRDVWADYQARGEENFRDTWYSEELHFRLKRVRLGLTHLAPDTDDIAPKQSGPDPRAAKYAFVNFGPVTIEGEEWRIDWSPIADWPTGWYFGPCDGKERADPASAYYGAERVRGAEGHEPFNSSSLAFDGIWTINGYESPRPKPGRKIKGEEPNRRADSFGDARTKKYLRGASPDMPDDTVTLPNGKQFKIGWAGSK
jgi:hypothetical protein